MPEFKTMYRRQRKYMFLLLSIFVLGWGFTSYQAVFLGLILGTSLSLFNLWLIMRKVERLGEAVTKGQKVNSLGTISRMASAALVVMIALKYHEKVHLISAVIGLMTAYFVIMIDYFLQAFKFRK